MRWAAGLRQWTFNLSNSPGFIAHARGRIEEHCSSRKRFLWRMKNPGTRPGSKLVELRMKTPVGQLAND
jgi:hypothetical protein